MKKILFMLSLAFITGFVHTSNAQEKLPKEYTDEEIGWIKKDFQKSDVVASVKIERQELKQTIGNPTQNGTGYAEYLVTGKVNHSYIGMQIFKV